jgi:hypothetical protein
VKSEALDLIAQVQSVQVQPITGPTHSADTDSSAPKKSMAAQHAETDAIIRSIDPRTIRREWISELTGGHNAEPSQQPALQRVVRILNVRTNHYMVHLPRSRDIL